MSLSIYFHLPYCIKKCPFCDFNSYGVGNKFPETEYLNSMLKELKCYESIIINKNIKSIYFGGGTPSLFSPKSIGKLINRISTITCIDYDAEITLEVNPKAANYTKFEGFRREGINRVSVGVQSFSSRKLNVLGRLNNPEDNYETINDLNRANISNISIDLMYGTPDETIDEWSQDLEIVTGLSSKHISAYCLTIEEGTEFYKRYYKGELILPGEDNLLLFIQYTSSYLNNCGYTQYEISNFAINGYESKHNSVYWMGEDYIGIGAGAHSHLNEYMNKKYGVRWSNIKNPAKYMNNISKGFLPIDYHEELSLSQSFKDSVMMGIRLIRGIDTDKLKLRYDMLFDYDKLEYLFEEGFLVKNKNYISLNNKGIPVSNYIISKLIQNTRLI